MIKQLLKVGRLLPVLLLFIGLSAFAQEKKVTGRVTAADDGSGIPGVNIVEKGTSNGAVTDADGNFSIGVGSNATLVFSAIGFTTQEIAVGAETVINVSMATDVTSLAEIVVIGYGSVEKKDATGAVASIKSEDFNRGIISSPEQLIQGKTAGVQITSNNGEPGGGVSLRIRGTSSVRGGNNPLFVVDGIPLSGDDVTPGASDFGRGAQSTKNPLNFINPNDIESIDILKDASATAIYGSRGANGVVIITTKSGKGKKQSIEYNTSINISRQAKYFDVLDAKDFLTEYENAGGDPTLIDYGSDTDWQREISRTAVSQNHNIAYGNSYKTGNYRAAINFDDQVGIIKNSGMKRLTGRLNWSQSLLKDKLKLTAQTLISNVKDKSVPIGNTTGFEGDLVGTSIFYNPTIPAYPSNFVGATTTFYSTDASNPLTLLQYYSDNTNTNRKFFNFSAAYDITSSLNIKVNTGIDRSTSTRESAMSGLQTKIGNVAGIGRADIREVDNNSDLLEVFMNYKVNVANNPLTVLAGYSYQSFEVSGQNTAGAGFGNHYAMADMIDILGRDRDLVNDFITQDWMQYEIQRNSRLRIYDLFSEPPAVTNLTTGLPATTTSAFNSVKFGNKNELQSFFARGNYNIGQKYFLTASVRVDGSTRFGDDNKYGVFPSAAAKWRLSEESFAPEFFDDLAVRVGYGVTGNQSIGHNVYSGRQQWGGMGLNNDGTIGNQAGLNNVSFANPNLQWEQTSQLNLGIDFGIYESRINGSIDVYRKNTTKLLMQTLSAQPAPTPFVWENLDADVINSGVELTLNGVAVDKQNFGVNVNFNIAYNKNMVKNYSGSSLPTGQINGKGLTDAYAQRIENNQPLFAYYLREFVGYGSDGLNADDDIQKFVGKSALPKVNSGLSVSLRAYDFDFSAYAYGQFGQYVYNNTANAYFTMGSIGQGNNVIPSVIGTGESTANSPDVSTRFLEKGDFVRLQNLSAGYTLKVNQNKGFKKIRFSATAQNLFVLTDYSGRDPEVNVDKTLNGIPSFGIDYNSYPRARTFTVGIGFTF